MIWFSKCTLVLYLQTLLGMHIALGVPLFLPAKSPPKARTNGVTKMEIDTDIEYSDVISSAPPSGVSENPVQAAAASSFAQIDHCPAGCVCSVNEVVLRVTGCPQDPTSSLDPLLLAHPNITTLKITNSRLKSVPDIICSLKQINTLDLTQNQLSDIPGGCVKRLPLLRKLVLTENSVRTLRNGSLYGFPSLSFLAIDRNGLSEIESDVFDQVEKLPPLKVIILSKNNLVSVDSWVLKYFQSGRSLDIELDENQISLITNKIGWKYQCNLQQPWIGRISLQDNNITHFSDVLSVLGSKSEAEYYCLFKENYFTLDLRYNAFDCDCVDYRKYVLLHSLHKSGIAGELFCAKPRELYNKRILSIPLHRFTCRVQEDCPGECECLEVPHKFNMSIDCRGLNLKTLPETLPKLPAENYHYNLYFSSNNLTTITGSHSYLKKSKTIDLGRNHINDLSLLALGLMRNANEVNLRGNHLSKLPYGYASVNVHSSIKIYLGDNPWNCGCDFQNSMETMMQFKPLIPDRDNLICAYPTTLKGHRALSLRYDPFSCGRPLNMELILNIGIATGALIASLLIFILPMYLVYIKRVYFYSRLQWHPFDIDECEGEDKEFDVFVSYASEDERFVENYLLPKLLRKGYKVCYHRISFPLGQPIMNNIEQCIGKSKRTIVVFSDTYRKNQWCMLEFSFAIELTKSNGSQRIIVIFTDAVDPEYHEQTTRDFLNKCTIVERESHLFWEHLLYRLPQSKLGREEVCSPSSSSTTTTTASTSLSSTSLYDAIRRAGRGASEEEERLLNCEQLPHQESSLQSSVQA